MNVFSPSMLVFNLVCSCIIASRYRRRHARQNERRKLYNDVAAVHHIVGRRNVGGYMGFRLGRSLGDPYSPVLWFLVLSAFECFLA